MSAVPSSTQAPPFTIEHVQWLQKAFTPVTHTPGVDLRQIDFRSGQFSVVEFIRLTHERQVTHGSPLRPEQGKI